MTFVPLNLGLWTVISTIGLMPITMLHHGLRPSAFGIGHRGQRRHDRVGPAVRAAADPRTASRTVVLAIAAILVGVGFGAVAFAPTVLLLGLTVAVWTLGEMTASPSNSSLVADLSARDARPLPGRRIAELHGRQLRRTHHRRLRDRPLRRLVALWLGGFGLGLLVAAGHLIAGPAGSGASPRSRPHSNSGAPTSSTP